MSRRLVLLIAALAATACAEPPGDSTLVRLVDQLPYAEVESPLARVPAASSVSELEDVAVTEVWRDGFEPAPSRLAITGSCTREQDERAGSVLACRKEGRAEVELAIEPGTVYRVRLRARRKFAQGYVVSVTEGSEEEALRIFQFPDFQGPWQPFEIWFHSTPRSRRLSIAVESRHSRAEVWLDDLVVERLELTPAQELSLLRAQQNRPAPPNVLGFVKRGRLLPVDEPELADSPLAENYTVRDAIFAPAPTDIHFDLSLPPDARLALSYAFAEQTAPGEGVRFRVLAAEKGQEPRVLLDESLVLGAVGDRSWRWHEWQSSLADLGGRKVRLTLETQALSPGGRAYAFWGNPEIYTPRRGGEPNLVLIAVDTLRADRLSCYGHTPGTTPAIDSLADDGVRFDQAIASANWTVPSFLALFTGRNVLGLRGDLRGAPETTLAEHLRGAGYATSAIVYKAVLFDRGFDRGFDSFLNAPRYNIRAEDNLAEALEWLERNRRRRFFLFLHFNDPHQPFCQPPDHLRDDLRKRLRDFDLSLPIMVAGSNAASLDPDYPMKVTPRRRQCRACRDDDDLVPDFRDLAQDVYDDAVRYVDHQIGLFLAELKKEDLYDDSVIAFVSDHGETLWDHYGQFAHGRDNLHDELVHVPLIVKPPRDERWARGRVVKAQVRLIDLNPTLLELGGIEAAHPLGGPESLVPALQADAGKIRGRPAFSTAENHGALSLRHDGFKYIRYFPDGLEPGGGEGEELYDLEKDPAEKENVAEQHPEILTRLRRAMDALLSSAEAQSVGTESATQEPVDARQLEALRALGYIQ